MKHWHLIWLVLVVAGVAQQAVSQDYIPRLPDGVGVATVGSGVVDSGTGQYNNSSKVKNKIEATGFGPLLQAAFNFQSGLAFGVPTAPAMDFNALELRTRGYVYGAAYTHGVSDDVTVNAKFRMGNLTTRIKHDQDPSFGQAVTALTSAGFESPTDSVMNDRLISAQVDAAFWLDDEYLDDDLKHESAVVVGYTHRGSWQTGAHDLVDFALSDLARMNRPPFVHVGFQGKLTDEFDGVEFTYGAQLNYHFRGKTREVNPAIVLSNAANAFFATPAGGGTPLSPSLPPIQGVTSGSHLGYEYNLGASMPVDEDQDTRVGLGVWGDYEAGYGLRDVGFSGNPFPFFNFDANRKTERAAQSRGYVRLSLSHSTIEAFQAGDAALPYILSLKFDKSVYGRNQSTLKVLSLNLSVPLTRPNS